MKAPMLLALAALSISTAQAAEPTGTLTLACQGTSTFAGKDILTTQTQVSLGIIVNFADRTVAFGGNADAGNFPVIKIIDISEAVVSFLGGSVPGLHISGSIDRVTGDVEATSEATGTENRTIIMRTLYSLKCKPTQRML
jgi:hypothetical protein